MDPNTVSTGAPGQDWLAGGGEMGERIRSMDWSTTGLGPLQGWTQSLRSAIGICLGSRFPIVIYWGRDRVVLYNDSYAEILGKKHPWALGQPCREVWSEIWEIIAPMLEGVMTRGEATWSDDQLLLLERRGYPEECYFSFSFSPVHGADGTVEGIFTAVIETTRRVLGERRLRTLRDLAARAAPAKDETESWKSAAEALDSNREDIPFALLYRADVGSGTARLAARAGSESVTRCAPETIDFASPSDNVWPSNQPAAAVLPVSRSGVPAYGYLVAGLSPRRPFDEEYRGFLDLVAEHVATGIANARAHEEERKRAEALAEIDRAKTAFFSNVSHELRTPLTLMLGPLEDILAKPPEQEVPGARDLLAVVHRNGLRLQKLVNTLLDFARIEAGRVEAVYEPTDLSALTAELASNFRSACERAGLRLTVDCPPIAEAAYVDRDMWEKIVLNLVSNACKFTFAGEIALALRMTEDAFELTVRDTGTGIPAQEMPHLFERFHRVKGARSRTNEGTGIGLALVNELVKLHGGSIGVESTPDVGSTFTVSIPRGKAHLPAGRIDGARTLAPTTLGATHFAEEAQRWLPEPASTDTAVVGEVEALAGDAAKEPVGGAAPADGSAEKLEHRARILWADDNADMRSYVRRLLADRYEVNAVSDGGAALASACDRPPDLVLADVMMPGLDGFGLLRELRAHPRTRDLPVILLTARAGEESRVEGLVAGADDYVIKPFSARELLARVEAHLRLARFRREAAEAVRKRERQLAAEAEALSRLNAASSRLWRARSLSEGLDEMLAATIELLGAQMGNVQLLDRQRNVLVIAAQRGFAQPFLHFFREVSAEDDSACGRALRTGERIVIEDVEQDDAYMPLRAVARDAGYRGVQSTPLIGHDGTPLGIISTHFRSPHHPSESDLRRLDLYARQAADFIERCGAEETAARLAAIIDSSDDAIVGKTLDGVVTSWNRGAERMFGYTAAEAIGQHITLIVPEDRLAEEHEVLARLRRGERIDHFQTERRAKDGRRITISLTVSPIRDATGRVVGASKVARDITERELAAQERRRAEHNARFLAYASAELANLSDYRTTLEKVARLSVPAFADWCAIDMLREDGTLERVAAKHSDPAKVTLAQELHRRWPLDRAAPRGLAKVLRDGEPDWSPDIPESLLQQSGEDADQLSILRELGLKSYICVPVRSRGKVVGALTFANAESARDYSDADVRVAEDVAYRASVAIENGNLYQALQRADRRKDEFLATLSHELRTPLNAIVGWIHVLRDGGLASDNARQAAEVIHRNAMAQKQLISDILDVSRIVAGKMRLDVGPVDLVMVIQAALDAVRPAAEAKQISVESVLDPKAGPVSGDPERLQQVVWNLLSNAVKFAPAKEGRIHVRLEAVNSHVRLTVEDNGPGIEPDFLPYVFDRFQQADASSTRKHGGLGLGLAIVKHLVELHGGTVRADNRAGRRGAIFIVELRRRSVAATASPPVIERHPLAEEAVWFKAEPALRGLRILVVDDEPDARDLVATVLKRCGAEVRAVPSAREGFDALREAPPDVLLADIEMPEQNGYDFIRQVRALPAELGGLTPAAALTAYASTADRMRTLDSGFQIHVPKPVQPPELIAVVASLARSRKPNPPSA